MKKDLENFEKLMVFLYVLKHGTENVKDQIKLFRQISGLSEHETQMAIDECVLRGFIDTSESTE